MKNNSLLLITALIAIPLFSQNYTPLLDEVDEWHFTTCYFGCHTDVYYTDGDTLVDGKQYKILDGYHYISRTFLLREDIQEKKVYLNLVLNSGNEEYLLYDFSLNVGDSIQMQNPITPFPRDGGFFILDSIVGKPLVNGNIYDFFYFSPSPSNTISTWDAVWVEGVGSLSIVTAPGGDPNFFGVGEVSCFFKGNDLFYTNLEILDECNSVLSAKSKSSMEEMVLFKPNPGTRHYITHAEQIGQVNIFSLQGKKVMSVIPDGKALLTLDLYDLKQGMYFIVVLNSSGEKRVFKVLR